MMLSVFRVLMQTIVVILYSVSSSPGSDVSSRRSLYARAHTLCFCVRASRCALFYLGHNQSNNQPINQLPRKLIYFVSHRSECIPEENTIPFCGCFITHQKQIPGLTHFSRVYPWSCSMMSRSFSRWDNI